MKNMSASVRARLLNIAKKEKVPFQRLLTLYNQEGLLHRTESDERNEQILSDILHLLSEGRSPLVISDRTEHLDILSNSLMEKTDTSIFTLTGTMGKKDRKEAIAAVREICREKESVLSFLHWLSYW